MSSTDKPRSLTVKRIAKLTQKGRYRDQGDGAVRGLYLQVNERGVKSWILRYQVAGARERMMGLGSADVFSLKEARERARAERQKLADKVDPLVQRRAERARKAAAELKTLTFREAAERYIAQREATWRSSKHAAQWQATLQAYAYPLIGGLSVADVDTALVLRVLEQPVPAERGYPSGSLWSARPETASRLRGRIEAVLDWATVRRLRTGDNPARWKGHLAGALPARAQVRKVEHHAALPYEQLPAFMVELREREGVAARALEFTILTAARTGEVVGARWDEIDLDERLWAIPAARMKAGRVHRVPLSTQAVELLRHLYREDGNPYVFIGSRSKTALSNMALLMALRRMGRLDLTAHGFRSTFSDWCAERTAFPAEVREMALAHVVGDKVEAAYRRGDLFQKRRQLAEAWADYCAGKASGAGGEVVSLQRRQP